MREQGRRWFRRGGVSAWGVGEIGEVRGTRTGLALAWLQKNHQLGDPSWARLRGYGWLLVARPQTFVNEPNTQKLVQGSQGPG